MAWYWLSQSEAEAFILWYTLEPSINGSGGGVKDWSKLPMDSTKKTADMGEEGVKNQ